MNYSGKILQSTTKVCKPLLRLLSAKYEGIWNSMHQIVHYGVKYIIKKNVTIAFYGEKQQLYLEIDTLGVSLETSLLQAMDGK